MPGLWQTDDLSRVYSASGGWYGLPYQRCYLIQDTQHNWDSIDVFVWCYLRKLGALAVQLCTMDHLRQFLINAFNLPYFVAYYTQIPWSRIQWDFLKTPTDQDLLLHFIKPTSQESMCMETGRGNNKSIVLSWANNISVMRKKRLSLKRMKLVILS